MSKNNWIDEKRRIETRVRYMCKDKIAHYSATISPAPKSEKLGEIESLREGILLYKKEGVNEVVLQPKAMGSYCAVYLYKNIEDTKFFSRQCYPIRNLDRSLLINSIHKLHSTLITEDTTEALVECELMPWSAMGTGLINREFFSYYLVHKDNQEFLSGSSIFEKLNLVSKSEKFKLWKDSPNDFKSHEKRQYESVDALLSGTFPDSLAYKTAVDNFKAQLDKYGSSSESVWIEPFNLVYTVTNGEKVLNTDNFFFKEMNSRRFLKLDLTDTEAAVNAAYLYKAEMSDLEGIMIKPAKSRLIGTPHALKVRTNDYLQLIYGVKFLSNFDYYMKKRRVYDKINLSCKAYKLHCLLSACSSEDERQQLLSRTLGIEYECEALDSRL